MTKPLLKANLDIVQLVCKCLDISHRPIGQKSNQTTPLIGKRNPLLKDYMDKKKKKKTQ